MRQLRVAVLTALLLAGCSSFGAPVAAGERSCVGLWDDACAQVIAALTPANGPHVAGFRIRCSVLSCTDASGSLAYDIVWDDGTGSSGGHVNWENGFDVSALQNAQPVPTPPVPPTCLRVTQEQCTASWRDAMGEVGRDRISSVGAVIVECTETCSSTSGKGRTVVVFQDQTRLTVAEWEYEGDGEMHGGATALPS